MPLDVARVAGAIRGVVGGALGRSVVSVEQLHGSVANLDFVVTLEDGARVVLKLGPESEIAAEGWALRRLGRHGRPVPELLALDVSGGELRAPYLILAFVEGKPDQTAAVVAAAGACLRQVHGIELPGWGPLVVDAAADSVRGRLDSWRDAVQAELSMLPELVRAGLLEPQPAARLRAAVDGLPDYVGPGVLLHNDLKPAHLFGAGSPPRLTAIIDWGDARVGDPAADLARLSMAGPAVTAGFLDGYGWAATPELEDRLIRYRLGWNAAALGYEYRAGGDWFDSYRSWILQDLDRLDRLDRLNRAKPGIAGT